MSPVGHSIIGLTFATIAVPVVSKPLHRVVLAAAFVVFANLPDAPIPNWGHDRYDISHSLFVNAALALALSMLAWRRFKTRIILLAACAWMSHLLLDSFYNHGRGVGIYWPISNDALNLSMPWFNTLDLSQSPVAPDNLWVYGIEAVAYGPILLITIFAVAWRTKISRVPS